MCLISSESGQPCGFVPCAEYERAEADNAKLREENDEFATIHVKEVSRHCEQEKVLRLAGIKSTKRAYKAMLFWRDRARRYRQERDEWRTLVYEAESIFEQLKPKQEARHAG